MKGNIFKKMQLGLLVLLIAAVALVCIVMGPAVKGAGLIGSFVVIYVAIAAALAIADEKTQIKTK